MQIIDCIGILKKFNVKKNKALVLVPKKGLYAIKLDLIVKQGDFKINQFVNILDLKQAKFVKNIFDAAC